MKVIDLLVRAGDALDCRSKGDARKLIRNGGARVNGIKVVNENAEVVFEDKTWFLIDGDNVVILASQLTKEELAERLA